MKFWDTPSGKIMSSFVHDHSAATCNIGACLLIIERELQNPVLDKQELLKWIEQAKNGNKRAANAADRVYERIKEITQY